jgi:hypothetical protein
MGWGTVKRLQMAAQNVENSWRWEGRRGENRPIERCFQQSRHTTAIAGERTSWRRMETSL